MPKEYTGDDGKDIVNQTDNHNYTGIFTYGGADEIKLLLGKAHVKSGADDDMVINRVENNSTILLGAGDDTYTGTGFSEADRHDTVHGGGGHDTFRISTRMSDYYGDDGNDSFFSFGYSNSLHGGKGIDTVSYIRHGNDPVLAGSGVTIDLALKTAIPGPSWLETLSGIENATGTAYADTINGDRNSNILTGYIGDDIVDGGGGNDTVYGRSGNDTVRGGAGDDVVDGGQGDDYIVGGAGKDSYRGGSGADIFAFTSITDSAVGPDHEIVPRMKKYAEANMVDVSGIDAIAGRSDDAFDYIWKQDFSGTAGELRFKDYLLQADVDGDGIADFEVFVSAHRMRNIDFIL